MAVIGITGGIAAGKSSFVRALLTQLPGDLFDADASARLLLDEDADARAEFARVFGREFVTSEGKVDRVRLRAAVFQAPAQRKELEAILHPRVRTQWTALAEKQRGQPGFLYVDIPLLFETGAESFFDCTVAVACSPAVQHRRLREQRHLTPDLAEQIVAAQLDPGTKIKKADHVIWNDSTVSCLDGQAALFAGWLRHRYG